MITRAKQFFSALFARLSDDDTEYVKKILPREDERELFFAMSVIDERHALNTARTAEKFASAETGIDRELLLRVALLHDVGRVRGDMGLWGKTFAVLAVSLLPHWAKDVAKKYPTMGDGIFRHRKILFVYFNHATIGAAKLRAANLPREAAIVAAHHMPETDADPAELVFLRRADAEN